MRVSDSMRYALLQANISKVAQRLDSVQQKVSTQKEINVPSDDPIKFATAVQYDAERSIGRQFNDTLTRLNTLVGMYDTAFSSITDQLNSLSDLANTCSTMDSSMRLAAGEQIQSIIEQLVTVGNTKLGNMYIFGGQQADSAPFHLNSDYSVTYGVSQQAEDATSIYVDKGQLGRFGISGREAFYGTDKIAFGSVSNNYTGDIFSNTDSFVYVIDGSNNTVNVSGHSVTLASGIYTGGALAGEVENQIENQLGIDCTVAFDSASRKFLITNNSGAAVTFNWSTSSASTVLGFNNIDGLVKSGQVLKSDIDTGRRSFAIEITKGGSTTGAPASRATYRYSIDGGLTWTTGLMVNTGGADDTTGDIVIDATTDPNNALYLNDDGNGHGTLVTLTGGTYTGTGLAEEIQEQLDNQVGTGFQVAYNADTRKFTITNQTGNVVTFNWSDSRSTVAGVLGFESVDSVVSNGSSETSDYVSGMFIDGEGKANTTNNGIKLLFGTTGNLVAGATPDTFQVKDLSIFELLKNFKDAFDSGNSTWISQNAGLLDQAAELTSKNNAVIAFEGIQANTLMANNKTKDAQLESMQSELIDASMADLAVEFNALLNTYQALLSTLARMQSVSILNYLK